MKRLGEMAILILILFLFNGCSQDDDAVVIIEPELIDNTEECEEIASLGIFQLLEESRRFIPYPDSIKRIIFIDSSGQELAGLVRFYDDESNSTTQSGYDSECPIDTTVLIRYNYKPVKRRFSIEIREIDISISVYLTPSLTPLSSEERYITDMCYIYLNSPIFGTTNSYMSIVVDKRTNPNPRDNFSLYKTAYQVGDSVFEDVYINSIDEEDDYEILYSENFGLLGIRTTKEPRFELVYNRIEF